MKGRLYTELEVIEKLCTWCASGKYDHNKGLLCAICPVDKYREVV
jgi:hypothetical protein